MFRNLFGARLPRLALPTLLLAMPFAAILAEPSIPSKTCSKRSSMR
jgi:type IV secretion system protein VirB2